MRALTSCALNATLVQALETQWHWQVDTVEQHQRSDGEPLRGRPGSRARDPG